MRADRRRNRHCQALALALAALVVSAAPAEARSGKTCQRKGSTTVKATRQVRVFAVSNGDGGKNLVGCLRASDRRAFITKSFDDGIETSNSYSRVTVNGRFVAWQETYYDISCKAACPPGYDPTSTSMHIMDLSRRKRAHTHGSVASDGRLVVTKGGAMAWTERDNGVVEVDAFDALGHRLLDGKSGIGPGSLRLHRRTVSWKRAGKRYHANLRSRV